jgi:DNA repair protein RadA/Sms
MARQCNSCKEWNTIAEEIIQKKKRWPGKANRQEQSPKAFKINEIDSTQEVRMDTTDSELNRVLEVLFPGP